MKFKEALIALGMTSIVVMSINIIVNSVILVFVWNSLVSSIHPALPELSFFNAVGVIVVAYIVQGKFSIKVNVKY
ncbi:hypothetical protein AB733_22375 [Photobacterium swingsii]|uniref:Uncharacterized protein n=1 Tax=Photobacterium swingsii TaxID=680026 RepID=A0A0J8V650_9GAMM|nr:hypothetical protein [Photobacterium swingsii]KMV28647.1 hypothetical protein AB733_22375 [Photobacterium swingsii]PSW26006.1 hypothetical protein C9I94_05495 [Photobacterium swingsii]